MTQKVFLAKTRNAEELELKAPCAEMVSYDGPYFFLYPDILRLREQTGELIEGQTDAFFDGPALDALEQFLANSRMRVGSQPEHWEQRVGRRWPGGEPVFDRASRTETIEVLDKLLATVLLARQSGLGVFFLGE